MVFTLQWLLDRKAFTVHKLKIGSSRAIPEYFSLAALLMLIGYAAYHEKNGIIKRTYVGLISLALASAITSLSAHIKLLTLPAFTVLFGLSQSFRSYVYQYTYELYTMLYE